MKKPLTSAKGYGVTAVLGPTNTGKTHLAIERMVSHRSGLIGLPLRLLAREVYNRLVEKVGAAKVSLVTGEERITPSSAVFQVCTVEAMPEKTDAEFVAIDEVQIATDLERGHFFTDRILNLRGTAETMLLGADTMIGPLRELLPGISIITRPRMSILQYAGSKKITRMPARSAIVAFSADEVYAIAELVRRERGGAAVVTGSLSPRTRNAQVALYQSGDVDFLIATDAIGMGLNLDVDHVAFAQDTKFDGFQFRKLTAAELAQVAGRAGRHTRDGTFGVTSRVAPFDEELIEALETHIFAPAKVLTWRSRKLDFGTLTSLRASLDTPADHPRLMKAPSGTDIVALDSLIRDTDIIDTAQNEENVRLLWEVAKTPDYRKISPSSHAEILGRVYLDVAKKGVINEDWFAEQVRQTDNSKGGIDALSQRIASVRTWTYLSNRDGWLENAPEWREKTREVEDRLSDALHETLTKRFIDRRTSVLMKRLKENRMLEAEIGENGSVTVEGHELGTLRGFRFVAGDTGSQKDAKALNAAAAKALAAEIEKRADRLSAAPNSDFLLGDDGTIRWVGEAIAKLSSGEEVLKPKVIPLADEHLTGAALDKVTARLNRWIANHVNTTLKPLADLAADESLPGIAKGIAFRLAENLGILERKEIAADLKNLDQEMRGAMRRHGVRFGAYHVFMPILLKPAASHLICLLWACRNDRMEAVGLSEVPQISAAGRTSAAIDSTYNPEFYRLCGFKILGTKAVRIDILERLADLIRPITSFDVSSDAAKPEGWVQGRAFYVTPAMMSILGATHEDMIVVLKGLGYRGEPKLEADVKPQVEEATAKSDNTSSEVSEAAEPETEAVTPDDTPAPETPADAETKAEPKEDDGKDEDEGPKTILVWRFGGGSGNRQSRKPSDNRKFAKGKGKKDQNRGKSSGHNSKKGSQPKREKEPDPDSPFAKLAALKEGLTAKDG